MSGGGAGGGAGAGVVGVEGAEDMALTEGGTGAFAGAGLASSRDAGEGGGRASVLTADVGQAEGVGVAPGDAGTGGPGAFGVDGVRDTPLTS